jgi:hypothetical protein
MHHSVQMAAWAEELSNRTRTGSKVAGIWCVGSLWVNHIVLTTGRLLSVYLNKQTFHGLSARLKGARSGLPSAIFPPSISGGQCC